MRTKSLVGAALALVVVVAAACQPTKPPPPPPDVDVVVLGDSIAFGIGCQLGDPGPPNPNIPPQNCPGRPGISAANGYEGACNISGGTLLLYNGTTINTHACHDYQSAWPAGLAALHPEVVILLTGQWEIVDRWSSPPGFHAPERQWAGSPSQDAAAAQGYRNALQNAVNIITGVGAKVILVNSAYSNVPVPDPVWWEAYRADSPNVGEPILNSTPPLPTTYQHTWVAPHPGAPYKSAKTKVDRFNAELAAFVATQNPANVQLFNMWELFTPNDLQTLDREWHPDICVSNLLTDPATCPETPLRVRDPDGGHFTPAGYAFLTDAMLPMINAWLP